MCKNTHEKLIYFRKKYNKTQEDIAKVLDIRTNTYNQYEKKRRTISFYQLCILAKYYNISLDSFAD